MKTPAPSLRLAPLAAACGGGIFLLSGCLGPAYHRPDVPAAEAFKELPAASSDTWHPASPNETAPRGAWWTLFGDPRLDELESRAAASNQSLRQAQAQYREAIEVVSSNRADYFPLIETDPTATRQRGFTGSSGAHPITNTFDLPVTASWEPDLWGQIGKSVDIAKESAQSSAALLENALLSIQAQLAVDYFSLEESDMEEGLLTSAMDSYAKALQLTKVRYGAGIASQADVSAAESQLDSARAQAADVALSRAKFEHAIAVLAGQPPSSFSLSSAAIAGVPPPVPLYLPSRLLERRPDVASAERLAAAANSTIGLARTAFFPAVTLAATGGYEGATFAQWINWPDRIWSLGASAAGTIFDFGRHEAQYRQAKDAYDASIANYRQTALSAFQEVEDDLASLSYLAVEGVHQDAATKSAEQSLSLEIDRYKGGIVSYLDVITTQNIALTSERASAQVLGRRMEAAVDLIKAVGGGWDQSRLPFAKVPPAPLAKKLAQAPKP
ncbi:MAG TPA: efflux transporter outer membrane subunit [Elusimicrobiota bacterium]|jgi:NodT family efflux transporter outer membrane factor (OMF) lipoprotein|nr:efflux transporter outer membrane subunit [Elusimicrobiota bacterium]